MNTIREQMENQLQRLHKNNMQELVACLDSEMWSQCAPTPSEQRLLRALIESSEVSSTVSTKEDNSIASIHTLISEAIRRVSKSKNKQRMNSKSTLVHIKGRSFRVVGSMLVSLRLIASYVMFEREVRELQSYLFLVFPRENQPYRSNHKIIIT